MDRRLYSFLKSRAIFTHGGAKSFHEYVTAQEQQSENKIRARKAFKKATKK